MKTLSEREGRGRDRDDLRELLAAADPRDLLEARELLALITARGFHRDKDLVGCLARFEAELRGKQGRQ